MTLEFTEEILEKPWHKVFDCPVFHALSKTRPDLEFSCGYHYFHYRSRETQGSWTTRLMPDELRSLQDSLSWARPFEPFTFDMEDLP